MTTQTRPKMYIYEFTDFSNEDEDSGFHIEAQCYSQACDIVLGECLNIGLTRSTDPSVCTLERD